MFDQTTEIDSAIVGGTSTSGYSGTIVIKRWDSIACRYRLVVGYIGEDGLLPSVPYYLNDDGNFVERKNESD
jgi:hypothetical protein